MLNGTTNDQKNRGRHKKPRGILRGIAPAQLSTDLAATPPLSDTPFSLTQLSGTYTVVQGAVPPAQPSLPHPSQATSRHPPAPATPSTPSRAPDNHDKGGGQITAVYGNDSAPFGKTDGDATGSIDDSYARRISRHNVLAWPLNLVSSGSREGRIYDGGINASLSLYTPPKEYLKLPYIPSGVRGYAGFLRAGVQATETTLLTNGNSSSTYYSADIVYESPHVSAFQRTFHRLIGDKLMPGDTASCPVNFGPQFVAGQKRNYGIAHRGPLQFFASPRLQAGAGIETNYIQAGAKIGIGYHSRSTGPADDAGWNGVAHRENYQGNFGISAYAGYDVRGVATNNEINRVPINPVVRNQSFGLIANIGNIGVSFGKDKTSPEYKSSTPGSGITTSTWRAGISIPFF